MKYEEALNFAVAIMKHRPTYILGGSVALMLQGAIEERTIGDFDFILNVEGDIKSLSPENGEILDLLDSMGMVTSSYPVGCDGDYIAYKVELDRLVWGEFKGHTMYTAAYYNIFLRNKTKVKTIKVGDTEIKVQCSSEILKYKKAWLRAKDRQDIEGTHHL